MTVLSVNVNKLALVRNSRGGGNPDLADFSRKILAWGAHGITVHPRPDERHVKFSDLPILKKVVREHGRGAEFNVEGFPSEDFMRMVTSVKPDQCTLVPDPPHALTSDAGWNFVEAEEELKDIVQQFKSASIRTSLFLDPRTFDSAQEAALARIAPDRIEFYTESFSAGLSAGPNAALPYVEAAGRIEKLGIEMNAGHDLNQSNLAALLSALPGLKEVSIGHALICEALIQGFETTIKNYLGILSRA